MSMYVAPHHVSSKRSRTRLAKILLAASLLVPTSLLAIANAPVSVDPSHNPIYTTIQDVQSAINTALAPIQSAIVSLQQQQTNQATQLNNQQSAITDLQSTQSTHTSQISDLQAQQTNQAQQIAKLQSSTAKNLIVYDANNQELGLLIGHGGSATPAYEHLPARHTPHKLDCSHKARHRMMFRTVQ